MAGETKVHLRLPDHIWTRIVAQAERECLTATQYLRRFLAVNIDVIDPVEVASTPGADSSCP